jgi:RimJ/RimL family protein N-acetyltransferase
MKIETKRLILREWKQSDTADLVDGLDNIKVSKWLVFVPHPYTKKDAKKWIDKCIKDDKKGDKRDAYEFAVELKSEKKVIGGVSISKINKFQGTACGGIWINSKYQKQGYGAESFRAKIDFAFNKLKLRRLDNGFLEGNDASFNMQKKLGFKVEGKRRKGMVCEADGKIKDEYTTGLLKEEWKG